MSQMFRLGSRLKDLGKRQTDLMLELTKRGIKVNPSEMSQAVNGTNHQTKILNIASAANEIVSEWEQGQAITQ